MAAIVKSGMRMFLMLVMAGASSIYLNLYAQESSPVEWIRPGNKTDNAVWGIRNGIVLGLWPATIEQGKKNSSGGPRGLLRLGYEFKGKIYHINYIAIEPVVDGKMEFSEISPSRVDGKWGKLMWAGEDDDPGAFFPSALTRGNITHPDANNPEIEELSFYIFMEEFLNGALPYFKVNIRSDKREEIGFEIFNRDNSAEMERCVLTATMGNYARLRKLHLKGKTIDSRELYRGFKDIDFIEKEEYPIGNILKNGDGDFIAVMETNESFEELSSWPQAPEYFDRWNWRYRPFFKTVQYWRKEADQADASLRVRVNGRAAYWAGGSTDKKNYTKIPGGPAFENFELRENYYSGQRFYFGISRRSVENIVTNRE